MTENSHKTATHVLSLGSKTLVKLSLFSKGQKPMALARFGRESACDSKPKPNMTSNHKSISSTNSIVVRREGNIKTRRDSLPQAMWDKQQNKPRLFQALTLTDIIVSCSRYKKRSRLTGRAKTKTCITRKAYMLIKLNPVVTYSSFEFFWTWYPMGIHWYLVLLISFKTWYMVWILSRNGIRSHRYTKKYKFLEKLRGDMTNKKKKSQN